MKTFSEIYQTHLQGHRDAVDGLSACQQVIQRMADEVVKALREGKKVVFFGNGGSAADAQHLAAEFVIRYRTNRISLPALALTTDTSMLTACGNDFGFETVFSRQIEGLAQAGDVVVGITTSGNSPNVVKGLQAARARGCITISWTAQSGGQAESAADIALKIPTPTTAHAQECHIMVGHMVCEFVDQAFATGP